MIKRIAAALTGITSAGNGFYMLADGRHWFGAVTGVSDTGPFNPHFVADVGAAFLIAGLALIARAWRPQFWPAALAGAGFLCAHALIHVAGLIGGLSHHAGFELASVIAPALLALWASLPARGERHAS